MKDLAVPEYFVDFVNHTRFIPSFEPNAFHVALDDNEVRYIIEK